MAKTKISEFSSTPANNTDIDSINLAEGCAPSGINDAIRELMAQLKDWQSGTSNDPYVVGSSGSLTLNQGTANGVAYLNGSKVVTSGSALTFDGTNLGLGGAATSFGAGFPTLTMLATSGAGIFQSKNTAGDTRLYANTDGDAYLGSWANTSLRMYTNSTLKATLNTSGNLGLGVTPSAWSTGKAIEVGRVGNAIWNLDSNETYFLSNAYFNSGFKYGATGTATQYLQFSGQHRWYNAPSGTAGDAITFTQAMTLDASGNLGVGTTSPSSNGSGWHAVDVRGSTGGELRFGVDGGANFALYASASAAVLTSTSAIPIIFGNNNTERARIDSSGNLLVGTTSAFSSGKVCIQVANGSTQNGITIQDNASNGFGYVAFANGSGSTIGSINRVAGTSAVVYNTTSDYRLKTVTGAVAGHGARIDALKPVDYKWTESGQQARGFLAHEFQTVYPNSVTGDKDAVDAEGNPKYQSMQAGSSEVIADLVAEIQSLRKRLADAGIA